MPYVKKLLVPYLLSISSAGFAGNLPRVPNTFVSGDTVYASEVNEINLQATMVVNSHIC
ncbi:MAG: hypothetical protein ACC707_13660 [Thiohalomonadales bacterium]